MPRMLVGANKLAPHDQAYTNRLEDAELTYTAAIQGLAFMQPKLGDKKGK